MTTREFVIGIDLDNTLVCYDDLFHSAACEEGLIDPSLARSKEKIRGAIRLRPEGERDWTRLQALVYGTRMSGARLFEGADVFLRHCTERSIPVKIVSHKTPSAKLDGRLVHLRKPALEWLQAKGFFRHFAVSPGDVFFESTRVDKIGRIRSLRCTHFVDDLPEVFAEPAFPRETRPLLFAPHGVAFPCPGVRAFANWCELDRFFFDDAPR